jgi:hypothetical protein
VGSTTRGARKEEQLALPAGNEGRATGETHEQEELVRKLMSFKVSEKKARELVKAKPEAVRLHILALPYLPASQGQKNFAGRLITAIENDYELPQAFVEAQEQERRQREESARATKAKGCPYCKEMNGFRYVKGNSGPVRRCTHDPAKEAQYS